MNTFFAALEGLVENVTETAQQFDRNSTVEELLSSLQDPNVDDGTVVSVFRQLADMAKDAQGIETWCQTDVLLRGVCQGFVLGVKRRVKLAAAVDVLRLMWLAMPTPELWEYFNNECMLCDAFSLAPKEMIVFLKTVGSLASSFYASDDIPTIIPDILVEVQNSVQTLDPSSVDMLHSLCMERKDMCPVIMFQDAVGILLQMTKTEDLRLSAVKVILALVSGGGPIIVRQLKEVNQLYPLVSLLDMSPNDVYFSVVLDILGVVADDQDAQNTIRKPLVRSLSLVVGLKKHGIACRQQVIRLLKRFVDTSQVPAIVEAEPQEACAVYWWAYALLDADTTLDVCEQLMELFCHVRCVELQTFLFSSMTQPTIVDMSTMVDPAIAFALEAIGNLETVKMDRVWFCLDLVCVMVFENEQIAADLARSEKFSILSTPFKWMREIDSSALYPPSLNGCLFVLLRLLVAMTSSVNAAESFAASPTLFPQVFRLVEAENAPAHLRGWAALFMGRCVGQCSKSTEILKLIESKVGLDRFNELLDFVKLPNKIPSSLWKESSIHALYQSVQNSLVQTFLAQATAASPTDRVHVTPMDSGLTDLLKMQDRELMELRALKEKQSQEIVTLKKVATDEDKTQLVLKLEAAEEAVAAAQEEVNKWRIRHMEEERARIKERQRFRRREKEMHDHLSAMVARIDQLEQPPSLQPPADPAELQELELLREALELIHAEVPEARKFLAPIGEVYHEEEEVIFDAEAAIAEDVHDTANQDEVKRALDNVAGDRIRASLRSKLDVRGTDIHANGVETRASAHTPTPSGPSSGDGRQIPLGTMASSGSHLELPAARQEAYRDDAGKDQHGSFVQQHSGTESFLQVQQEEERRRQHEEAQREQDALRPQEEEVLRRQQAEAQRRQQQDEVRRQQAEADRTQQEDALRRRHEELLRAQQEEGFQRQQEEHQRKQQEELMRAQQEEALRRQQEEHQRKQQEELLRAQQEEALRRQQEEHQRKQQEELLRAQQEEALRRQQEEHQRKQQQEELLRAQQEVAFRRQQEEHQRKQQEDLLRAQQEEALRRQQEEHQRKQQEELLRAQQEEALRRQQEELLRKQQECSQQRASYHQQQIQQPPPQQQQPQLPPGWSANRTPEGHVYYFNHTNGESRWTPP